MVARYVPGKTTSGKKVSMSYLKKVLHWEPLEHRRAKLRLKFRIVFMPHELAFNEHNMFFLIFTPHYTSEPLDLQYKIQEFKCRTGTFSS